MKLIVSCLISLTLLFNMSFAAVDSVLEPTMDGGVRNSSSTSIAFPNANNLFRNAHESFIDTMDTSLGGGLNAILLGLYKVGYTIAVIATVLIAIKLILTTPAKKAEVKAAFMPYLIGLLLLIAGVPIAIKVIEIYTKLF